MALKNCKKCGGTIDSSAKICPHCGAELQPSDLFMLVAIALFIYGGGGFLAILLAGWILSHLGCF
ncbi:MAG: zinc-ribbon domain-containing protein [Candidatus Coatesbacteria bacterium]|nr:zinc-ribbon domain-containing protein [Candidatus Coatesbacteria bacterium]